MFEKLMPRGAPPPEFDMDQPEMHRYCQYTVDTRTPTLIETSEAEIWKFTALIRVLVRRCGSPREREKGVREANGGESI